MSGFTILEDRELWYFLDEIPEPQEEEEEMTEGLHQAHKTKATIAEALRSALIEDDWSYPNRLRYAMVMAIADLEGDDPARVEGEVHAQRRALLKPELEMRNY